MPAAYFDSPATALATHHFGSRMRWTRCASQAFAGIGSTIRRYRRSARAAGIERRFAELLLDADQLVVLGEPVGARQRAGLDLPAIGRDREIGDRRILGLAGAVRHHRAIAGAQRDLDRVQRLGQRADLVDLDQDRVADALARCRRAAASGWSRTHRRRPAARARPSSRVSSAQPSQSSSAMPSSIDTIG